MNSLQDLVDALETIPGVTSQGGKRCQTLATNELGDIFILSGNNEIVKSTLRTYNIKTNDSATRKLQLTSDVKFDLTKFTSILSNVDGSLLVVWSETELLMIEQTHDKKANTSGENSVTYFVRPLNIADHKSRLVDVQFHPLSKFTIVLLFATKSLVVWNLGDLTAFGKQVFSLPSNLEFSCFALGHGSGWLKYTVFLGTTGSNSTNDGQIYVLCPVVPQNILLPTAHATELWEWFSDMENQAETWWKGYGELVGVYLSQCLGNRGVMGDGQQFVVSFDTSHRQTPSEGSPCLSSYQVSLQGPLSAYRSTHTSAGSRQGEVAQLLVPGVGRDAPPVLVVAYANGIVDFYLLDLPNQAQQAGFVLPLWRPLHLENAPRLLAPVPDLLLGDSLAVPLGEGEGGALTLLRDPVHFHTVHVSAPALGKSFLLSSGWLRDQQLSCAGEEARAETSKSLVYVTFTHHREENAGLQGVQVVLDPFTGHLLVVRVAGGGLFLLNLFAHMKLAELAEESSSSGSSSSSPHPILSEHHALHTHTQSLLSLVCEGLSSLPAVPLALTHQHVPAPHHVPAAEYRKLLVESAAALDRRVVRPLAQLAQGLQFRAELCRARYHAQMRVLQGERSAQDKNDPNPPTQNNNPTTQDKDSSPAQDKECEVLLLQEVGLQGVLAGLARAQAQLAVMVERVARRQLRLKEHAERCLLLVHSLRKKCSAEDRAYAQQVARWSGRVDALSRQVDQLAAMSRRLAHGHNTSTSPWSPGHHTPHTTTATHHLTPPHTPAAHTPPRTTTPHTTFPTPPTLTPWMSKNTPGVYSSPPPPFPPHHQQQPQQPFSPPPFPPHHQQQQQQVPLPPFPPHQPQQQVPQPPFPPHQPAAAVSGEVAALCLQALREVGAKLQAYERLVRDMAAQLERERRERNREK